MQKPAIHKIAWHKWSFPVIWKSDFMLVTGGAVVSTSASQQKCDNQRRPAGAFLFSVCSFQVL